MDSLSDFGAFHGEVREGLSTFDLQLKDLETLKTWAGNGPSFRKNSRYILDEGRQWLRWMALRMDDRDPSLVWELRRFAAAIDDWIAPLQNTPPKRAAYENRRSQLCY